MMDEQKFKVLQAFLERLPDHIAIRLAKAVEIDRIAEGTGLPHELILDSLRPFLRRAGDARTPNPLRLFCKPFEDLLIAVPRKEKQKGRIARAAVQPVWKWLGQTLLPESYAVYVKTAKTAVAAFRINEANDAAAKFWVEASQAIRAALDTEPKRKAARLVLGGDTVVADAMEMALLLAAGDSIREAQAVLPKHTPTLTEDLVWALRGVYDRIAASAPDSAPYLAVVAMNRLEHPWEAMRLPLTISRQTQDTLISSTDMGLVGELLLADMESCAIAIRAVRQPAFDPKELVGQIATFTSLSNGIVQEVEMRRDGHWGQRLMKDRAGVAEVMEGFMKRAPKEIFGALPTLKTGSYAGGPRAPDLSKKLDAEKADRAIRYSRLVVGCKPFAASGSFGAVQADATDEVTIALRPYCDDIVRELRNEGDKRAVAEQYFELAVEIATLFFSAEEGEFLRRRGRAALGTKAAA
jgi:hypothetical protein